MSTAGWEDLAGGYPVIVFPNDSAPAFASLDVELWDEPAFGLAPATLATLAISGGAVVVHVPVDSRAVEEIDPVRDPDALRMLGRS
jgi:hypothetical protein